MGVRAAGEGAEGGAEGEGTDSAMGSPHIWHSVLVASACEPQAPQDL
jgi:hypothetical protein